VDEIALHLLDVMYNSIEAGATELSLELREDEPGTWLAIKLTDNGRGMDASTQAAVFDPFYTSRKTRRVGLGLPLMRATAEATGGTVGLESEVGRGTTLTATFGMSHIDCPPLGDLPVTVATVISGNPALEVGFQYHKGQRELAISSGELRAALGDQVSLQDPAVFAWLREYLTQQIAELRGGAGR